MNNKGVPLFQLMVDYHLVSTASHAVDAIFRGLVVIDGGIQQSRDYLPQPGRPHQIILTTKNGNVILDFYVGKVTRRIILDDIGEDTNW